MCFAPQRRALFQHLNFQKCSGVLCTCWLRNVLRATMECTFSTSQVLKMLQSWRALYILNSRCVRATKARNFSPLVWPDVSAPAASASLLFDPPEEKHSQTATQLFYLFARLHFLSSDSFSSLIFFLLLFPSLTLPTSAFHLSILLEVWLLKFLRPYQ